jgi:acetylornithine/N-succinyldiaminopimelate aminotransferase
VALHVLQRLSDPALLAHVRDTGAWLGAELSDIARRTGRIRGIRGVGFMWGIDIMGPASSVVTQAMAAGLLVCTAGEHTIRLLPPLVATQAELADGLGILERVIA